MKRPTTLMTAAGFEALQKDKLQLQQQRIGAVKELSEARDMGDRSENAAYKSARIKLSGIDRRLARLEFLLRTAKIVHPTSTDRVEIGSQVTVRSDGEEKTWTIVGTHESDVAAGRLSHLSPLGRALIGRRVGDSINFTAPSGVVKLTIIKIT